jgi:hypothetical protein
MKTGLTAKILRIIKQAPAGAVWPARVKLKAQANAEQNPLKHIFGNGRAVAERAF